MTRRIPERALSARERALISQFLEEARREIHADYERAPAQFKAFLLYIEREIFSPSFSIAAARKAANLRSNNYSNKFCRITGRRPREYVEHYRICVAQKINKHTNVYHWQIGAKVGFQDPSVFARNYKKIVGYPPNREPRAESNESSTRSGRKARETSATSTNLDPRVSPNTAEVSICASRLDLSLFWKDIHAMTRPEIRNYILEHVSVVNLDHYHYLLQKAKYEARFDKARGRELCRCALDTLRLVEFQNSQDFPDRKAIGYAILANICKMEFDFDRSRPLATKTS